MDLYRDFPREMTSLMLHIIGDNKVLIMMRDSEHVVAYTSDHDDEGGDHGASGSTNPLGHGQGVGDPSGSTPPP